MDIQNGARFPAFPIGNREEPHAAWITKLYHVSALITTCLFVKKTSCSFGYPELGAPDDDCHEKRLVLGLQFGKTTGRTRQTNIKQSNRVSSGGTAFIFTEHIEAQKVVNW